MKINFNNTTFKGYNNVISNELKMADGGSLIYMAMQLNDEGHPDLTEWRKIKSQSELLNNTIAEDNILSIAYINKNDNFTPEIMLLNECPLADGKTLKQYNINYAEDKSYKNAERFILKAYTFLASLSKRLSVDTVCHSDNSLKDTVISFYEILFRLGIDENSSFKIATSSFFSNIEQWKTAAKLNKYIQNTMKVFFK